jgi:hypothetical protein
VRDPEDSPQRAGPSTANRLQCGGLGAAKFAPVERARLLTCQLAEWRHDLGRAVRPVMGAGAA